MRADGERTRTAILRRAAELATVYGLDGLSIGALADSLGISKSGLYVHFKSKEALQLATIDEAGRIFNEQVTASALQIEPGVDRLVAVCDAFFDYLQRRCFPGGCFFAVASLEMGGRRGPVKERVAQYQADFVALLRQCAVEAVERKQLPKTDQPDALAFELNGVILAANLHFVLHGNNSVLDTARQVVRRRLGRPGMPSERASSLGRSNGITRNTRSSTSPPTSP
jgi:AcrR family transcriptional regulator